MCRIIVCLGVRKKQQPSPKIPKPKPSSPFFFYEIPVFASCALSVRDFKSARMAALVSVEGAFPPPPAGTHPILGKKAESCWWKRAASPAHDKWLQRKFQQALWAREFGKLRL